MSNQEKKSLLKSTNGKFFVVTFVKKDGSIRKMVCRFGVTKGVKGTGHALKEDSNIVRVYDIQKKEFRSINLETLLTFKCGQMTYNS